MTRSLRSTRAVIFALFVSSIASFFLPATASAQIARVGLTRTLFSGDFVLGPDVAYDPVNNVYLVLMPREDDTGGLGSLIGVFVDTIGIPVNPPFLIASNGRAGFTRAVYSPTVSNGAGGFGGFLVTWSEPWGGSTTLPFTYSRIVAFPNRLVGTQKTLEGFYGPRDVAVGMGGVNFGVVWEDATDARGRRVDLTAAPIAPGPTGITDEEVGDSPVFWNEITSIAAHGAKNEFAVLYAARRSGTWFMRFARITTTGSSPSDLIDRVDVAHVDSLPTAAALQYSPLTSNYVAVWGDATTGVITGAEISDTGRVISRGAVSSTSVLASQNGMALSYGAASGTFLFLGYGGPGAVIGELRGIELNKHGAPNSAPIDVTALGVSTNLFVPRAAGRSSAPEWMVSVGGNNSVNVQVVSTSSLFGGSDLRIGGCATPDPFAAMGGGSCFGGGWLPPGMPAPDDLPPPPPPPPPPGPVPGGCTTPDPFAALGGGVCFDGGWFPPGMPLPGVPPTPPPPPPPPPPGPIPGGCTTPDPFVAIGGGTCFDGGWFPPGMPLPGVPPTPPPPPPPPPPGPIPGGCTTPDPFVAIGGGTCFDGGWFPPGMPIPGVVAPPPPSPPPPSVCTTPDPFVALGGGTCFQGGWFPPGMPLPGATSIR